MDDRRRIAVKRVARDTLNVMPFALLIIGAVLLASAVTGTSDTLFSLVWSDFTTGPKGPGFIYWFVAVIIIGSIGYIPAFKTASTAFLVLVILVLFLSKGNPSGSGGGFFGQFTSALSTGAKTNG